MSYLRPADQDDSFDDGPRERPDVQTSLRAALIAVSGIAASLAAYRFAGESGSWLGTTISAYLVTGTVGGTLGYVVKKWQGAAITAGAALLLLMAFHFQVYPAIVEP